MLWACLIFPSLPLDIFARAQTPEDAAHPFVVSSGGHYPRVVVANAAARETGIRAGQLISAALAFAPELRSRDRDEDAEAYALAQLATWALTFTPNAGLAPPDGIVAEIGGSLRLFSGLPQLVARLTEGAQVRGYTARLGLAPTPGAALLFARASHAQPVTTTAQLPQLLAPLPLALVDLDDTLRTTLGQAGITTFGQAAALPRDALARRGGDELVRTIDRALGRVADPRAPFVPPPRFRAKLELPTPVHDAEALGFGVNRLVQELATWLTARGLGVTRLQLKLAHERYLRQRGLPATVVPFAIGAPARSSSHLLGVLRERLARVALPAPVESIALASEETAPLAGRNLGLLPEDAAAAVEVPLVDRLRARLGEGCGRARGAARRASARTGRRATSRYRLAKVATPCDTGPPRVPPSAPGRLPLTGPTRRARYGCCRSRSHSRICSSRSHGCCATDPSASSPAGGMAPTCAAIISSRQPRTAKSCGSTATIAMASTTASGSCMVCSREWCAGVPHRAQRAGGAHKHSSRSEADTRVPHVDRPRKPRSREWCAGVPHRAQRAGGAHKHSSRSEADTRLPHIDRREHGESPRQTGKASNPGVPLIPVVFPIAALATRDVAEAVDQGDGHHIFRVLVA